MQDKVQCNSPSFVKLTTLTRCAVLIHSLEIRYVIDRI
jgi:hypothetical protein